jgi:hypothetical protein
VILKLKILMYVLNLLDFKNCKSLYSSYFFRETERGGERRGGERERGGRSVEFGL